MSTTPHSRTAPRRRGALCALAGALSLALGAAPAHADSGAKRTPRVVNACNTPDLGWGDYQEWEMLPTLGQISTPTRGGVRDNGQFDLLVHFHGHDAVRKEFVQVAHGTVLVGVDLGIGSIVYSRRFSDPTAFAGLVKEVEDVMSARSGRETRVGHIALSAWSAGYGAIGYILDQPLGKKVDALVLLDSVYAGYLEHSKTELDTRTLEPFLRFARRAAAGERVMFESYSSIDPIAYASTGQVAHYLVDSIGAKLEEATRGTNYGYKLYERLDLGGYHVRGYRGADEGAHCSHLGLMKRALMVYLEPRWRTPG